MRQSRRRFSGGLGSRGAWKCGAWEGGCGAWEDGSGSAVHGVHTGRGLAGHQHVGDSLVSVERGYGCEREVGCVWGDMGGVGIWGCEVCEGYWDMGGWVYVAMGGRYGVMGCMGICVDLRQWVWAI